jgi:predicted outer membrane repeat protein
MAIMVVLLALIPAACGTELSGGVNAKTADLSSMVAGMASGGSEGSSSVAFMQGNAELNKNLQVNQAQLQSIINVLGGTIQNAVDAASNGDTIKVWPGLYKENVKIGKSLSIIGSGALLTKVDGQGLGAVFETTATVDLALARMTIRNGAGGSYYYWYTGGGINDVFGGHLKVDSCILTNNHCQWGGAIFQHGDAIPQQGDAIPQREGVLDVLNSKFIGNSADYGGGAIQAESGKATIYNCEFRKNIAHGWGGGAINAPIPELSVSNSQFYQNSADGALYESQYGGYGGAIASGRNANIRNSKFEENMALNGGAIVSYAGSDFAMTVVGCYLNGNTASNMGGGIYTWSPLTVKGTTIIKNKAANGGGIYWTETEPVIAWSNVVGNTPNNIAHA